ncbi:type II toxin-antitoxin system HipA family toxin [Gallibacterium sp. AGMB14963]|uniref:type II toxin-antitoxin system HipA family toxin n=1 Tax=Gallibacterium faecale TaxID=3019086 RepID=UPI0022F17281|nr:HipA domain-containing protein [Gallibacterium sp. AGMB14963]MDA3977423.1 HipA domain-containing protein [Gallibacterium sp. AGMB14963]
MSKEIYVFASWEELIKPELIGVLSSDVVRGKESFRFSYDNNWLKSPFVQQIDPDLHLYSGEQYSLNAQNFRIFLDSCPDRWGRLLMKRREIALANQQNRKPKMLLESDYLLGVHDMNRMGALRFKTELNGEFLDNNDYLAAPPISSLKELEFAAFQLENSNIDDPDYLKWLYMLISPGSSLGGARPKASVIDEYKQLWIAKFPSKYDEYDVGLWEYLIYGLATQSGIEMATCRIEKFNQEHHTFLTQRFDRIGERRRHFTSALTQLGYYDGDYEASYLEIAQFITENGSQTKRDLMQLWRRIVFNIAVSNTDDHLRNHGFIYQNAGWILSPAYDLNPSPLSQGLHLNITDSDNRLDFQLAFEVAEFFQLTPNQAKQIYDEVMTVVNKWRKFATNLGISRQEQEMMKYAFNL